MDTFFAVKDPRQAPLRKRDFLLFDRIGVPMFNSEIAYPVLDSERADLHWLFENELVFGVQSEHMLAVSEDDPAIQRIQWLGAVAAAHSLLHGLSLRRPIDPLEIEHLASFEDYGRSSGLRVLATLVEHHTQRRTVPLVESSNLSHSLSAPDLGRALGFLRSLPAEVRSASLRAAPTAVEYTEDLLDLRPVELAIKHLEAALASEKLQGVATEPVIQIVLNELPLPDESVSWEQVVDFRSDELVRQDCLRLRKWMRKVSAATASPAEIVEELEDLRADYISHVRLHRLKQSSGIMETVLTVVGETLENLARFRPGAAVKAFFAVRQRRIALLEAESAAPGREVAYLIKVGQRFRRGRR
ncbi:MAG TPA: hypothetical protein VF092_30295 [Longimicrobium sp.]